MRRRVPITKDDEAAIKAALTRNPHATAGAERARGHGASTVWRVAFRAGIELTAGRKTMGRHRLSAEQRAAVIEAARTKPEPTQAEIARTVGISRPSVSRIIPRRRRRAARREIAL
jgi:CRP-like cAMP-binding protein